MQRIRTEMDEHLRTYKDCQTTALFRLMVEIVKTGLPYAKERGCYLTANTDGALSCSLADMQKFGYHSVLLDDVRQIMKTIEDDYVAQFGPRLTTIGPENARTHGRILTYNFDQPDKQYRGTFKPVEYADMKWHDTALAKAALAYKRCCHWDFAPGEAGIWLCYYLPNDGWGGGDNEMQWRGNLVGFVILYDHNEDGEYEALGHIWTAAAARRHGVASKLIQHARKHFPLRQVNGPLTEDSSFLFKKVWPEALKGKRKWLNHAYRIYNS